MKRVLQKTIDLAVVSATGTIFILAAKLPLTPFLAFVAYPFSLLVVLTLGVALHRLAARAPHLNEFLHEIEVQMHLKEVLHLFHRHH